jgi:hypothetical protein
VAGDCDCAAGAAEQRGDGEDTGQARSHERKPSMSVGRATKHVPLDLIETSRIGVGSAGV